MDIYKEVNRQHKLAHMNTNGNNVTIKYNKMKSGIPVPNRVFVGGICSQATENDLMNLFGKYGSVKAVKLLSNPDGSNRGYGFVTYEKADDVKRLENDSNNLFLNDKRLNIAPAYMKQSQGYGNRPEPLLPATPSLYFNNISYQYQDGASVYPSSTYAPPVTIVPQMPEPTFYHTNNYAIPATPYQGAALFYPLHSNTSQVVVGHQTFAPPTTNSTNYVHSSSGPTSSPPSSTKSSNAVMTTVTNSPEVHVTHSAPMVAAAIPPNLSNISSVPPPVPYPISHPPHYYNNSIIPPYSGEVFYNMVHGACFPMVISGQDAAYISYYDAAHETGHNNVPTEGVHVEAMSNYPHTGTVMEASEMNLNNLSIRESSPNSNNNNHENKPMPPAGPPPSAEHVRDNNSYSPENSSPANSVSPSSNVVHLNEYNSPSFVQHRGAVLYPNTPIPQHNVYFNSAMYVPDTTTPPMNQCPYTKTLAEHYISDHLPKRDQKYSKKYIPAPSKDTPPNIPEFPFFTNNNNNNYPGYVNRNVKEKDYKNTNGKNGALKPNQRGVTRNIPNGGGMSPKPRIFHNQNQYGGPPRLPKNDRNMHNIVQPNGQYMRNNPRMSRSPYDQTATPNCYNNYQNNFPVYNKSSHEGHRKSVQINNNNYSFRNKHEKFNGNNNNNNNNEHVYTKNIPDERSKKFQNQSGANEEPACVEQNDNVVNEISIQDEQQQVKQEQQVCVEMQNLSL